MSYKILGLNDPWHDSSFCFLSPGNLKHFELERFTRSKYEKLNPILGLCDLFPDELSDVTHVAIEYGEFVYPLIESLMQDSAEAGRNHFVSQLLSQTMGSIQYGEGVTHRLMKFAEKVQSLGTRVCVYDHHHCHAANAFYSSNFDSALVFTMDGGGYCKTPEGRKTAHFSAWSYDLENESPEKHLYTELDFSAGLAWWRGTRAVGLPWGSEGTLMAMSALGNPNSQFRDIAQNRALWYPMLSELSDDAMKAEAENLLADLSVKLNTEQDSFDFAFELQQETERVIRTVLQPYVEHYQGDICLAGGTFMNCVAVGKIKNWFPSIRRLYLPPAPYDGGICIGAAQIVESEIAGQSLRASVGQTRKIGDFSLGIRHSLLDVVSAVRSSRQSLEPCDLNQIAEDLASGQIVAVFQDSAESGRRALGNRSILADPRSTELKDYINREVKHRQWYRPFAPMVLVDDIQSWFEVDPEFQSPYMSFAQKVKEEKASLIPGVLHCDQSARVQTIDEKLNPVIYRLIDVFKQLTGVPVLLNTSFNDREPIVESPSEALATFLRTPIDQLFFPEFGVRVRKDRRKEN